jgi:AcrR family transcriptional regulator
MAQTRLTRSRRREILDAAIEVIAENGLCDTRVADVAKRAGLSPGLVIYYFDSKDRLLTEALTLAEDRFYLDSFHAITGVPSAWDRLRRLIEHACSLPGGNLDRGWILWTELWSRALHDSFAAAKREALDRRWRSTIEDIVRAGVQSGEFRSVEPGGFALHLSALMDGLAVQVILADKEVSAERMRVVCLDLAARELGVERA